MSKLHFGLAFLVVGLALPLHVMSDEVSTEEYGKLEDGTPVQLFTLKNATGMEARVSGYGAALVSLTVADRDGEFVDVTLGYDDLEGWLKNSGFFGVTAGRFANRIAHGKFTLDGKHYQLATNNSPGGIPCSLHGGENGFDKKVWKGTPFDKKTTRGVVLTYTSPDGEEGYPGTLTVEVTYELDDQNRLHWRAKATTDAPTVVNLANHIYWNLTGNPSEETILDHKLTLLADHYFPTNPGLIPNEDKAPVKGTPMDFTKAHKVGQRIEADFEALKFGEGYDHCWVLNGEKKRGELTLAAVVVDPKSGRKMEVLTDQPGIQFYAGNFVGPEPLGKGGKANLRRSGLCLETQNFPDAPNKPDFPSSVLRPGETYEHTMVHRFSIAPGSD